MPKHPYATATLLALTTAVISGTANFLNKSALASVQGPIFFTTMKNATVAVALIGLVLLFRQWRELARLSRRQWLRLLAIGVIGGSLPFALFFTGLAQTSAINASLIHKTLVLWVLLLAVPFLKERISWLQGLGIAAVFSANLLVGGFTGFKFNAGELLVLCATLLWAVENIIAKRTLADVSSLTVTAARMVVGSGLLLTLIFWRGETGRILELHTAQWGWIVLTGVLLTGYVLTWYAALKRAPATYVATLLVPATLVTNVLSAVFVTHAISPRDVQTALLFALGTLLVIRSARTTKIPAPSLAT
ncbi:MAG: DMT family transporter [bacterium]|nr:DMT family transporter [bacterium]